MQDRMDRVARIIADFNSRAYADDGKGRCADQGIHADTKKDILAMLKDKREEYSTIGKRATLALEVSEIVRQLNPNAQQYFHRVVQLI